MKKIYDLLTLLDDVVVATPVEVLYRLGFTNQAVSLFRWYIQRIAS